MTLTQQTPSIDDLLPVLYREGRPYVQRLDNAPARLKVLIRSLQAFRYFYGKVLEAFYLLSSTTTAFVMLSGFPTSIFIAWPTPAKHLLGESLYLSGDVALPTADSGG